MASPDLEEHFDVVIVGSGSAGGPLLARLSENPDRTVLLLEAGPDFPAEAEMLPGFAFRGAPGAPTPDLDWGYWSEPLANGRRIPLRRGRMVGGSSMINGCIAVRAAPQDFDAWRAMGASGWSYSEVLPYYEKVEQATTLKLYTRESWQPIHRLFEEAALELGFRTAADANGPEAWNGVVSNWPHNVRNQVRQGSLVTSVRQARPRPNVTIRACMLVDSVDISRGKATGVSYLDQHGARISAKADAVFLCAGAYGSPSILMRSGVGPATQLRALGVGVVVDSPVGEHLMDHPIGMIRLSAPPEVADMTGPITAAFARGDGWLGWATSHDEQQGVSSLSVSLAWNNPKGAIALRSADPRETPMIDHGFQDAIDQDIFQEPWSAMMDFANSGPFRRAGVSIMDADLGMRDSLLGSMRSHHHPAGGCCIGKVVAPDLSVFGVENLYVADASVFPINTSNNPNLTCMMVGERAADLFEGRLHPV